MSSSEVITLFNSMTSYLILWQVSSSMFLMFIPSYPFKVLINAGLALLGEDGDVGEMELGDLGLN